MQPSIFTTKGPVDPIKDKDILVERRELWQIIRLATQPSVYSYAAILSPRQTGKTTLLHHARSILTQQDCGVAYVDLSPLEGREEAACYQYVCGQILADLGGGLRLQRESREKLEAVSDPVAFREFLREVALRARPARVVIMLDEAKAIPEQASSAFFGTIRSVFTSRRKENEQVFEKLVFVLAGATELYALTSGENSPLNICEKIYLHDLDAQGAWRIAANLERAGCQVSRKASDYLYEQTGGHPYLTQRICSHLEIGQAPALTVAAIDQAIGELLRGDDNLEHITRQLSRDPKARAMARKILTADAPMAFSRVNPTLSKLEMIGVLADGDDCAIRNPIYEAALRRYFDLEKPAPSLKQKILRQVLIALFALFLILPLPTIFLYATEVLFADHFVSQAVALPELGASGYVRHDSLLKLNVAQEIEVEFARDAAAGPATLLVELRPREDDVTSADGKYALTFTGARESKRFVIRLHKSTRLQDVILPFLMERRRHVDLWVQEPPGQAQSNAPFYTVVMKLDYFSSFIGSVLVWMLSFFAGLGSIISHLDTLGSWRSHLAHIIEPRREGD